MKVRLFGDSVRIRLNQSEVDSLANGGSVEGETRFGPRQRLRFSIGISPAADTPGAFFSGGMIGIDLPESMVQEWASTEQTSIRGEQDHGAGILKIAVEKDFACLVPRVGEEDMDTFPNPKASH